MLNALVNFSLRHKGAVLVMAALLLAWGTYVATTVRLDVFPEFVPPQVTVQTESPGLSPEQVETLVTRPVETIINGVGSMDSIRSESIQGLSVITAVFKDGTNIFLARQMLAEKLSELGPVLPAGVSAPKMSPLVSSTMDLLKIGLTSEKLSPLELRTFADWTLKPRLLAVPGVAKVSPFGGEVRQMQIQVKPEQLVAHDLALTDVLAAARAATGVRGAGFIETAAQRILIQTEEPAPTAEDLGDVVVVQKNGASVRLRDVAAIVDGSEPKFGGALIMGKPGVLLAMASQFGANTLDATLGLEAALEEMKPAMDAAGITLHGGLHRPATFIEFALQNVQHSLMVGGGLVALILILFLLDLRTAFISFVSIPLSLLAAVLVLNACGATISTITLGGFAVAIGVVVDDAIIDVENILRRLRLNSTLASPRPLNEVILQASLEVRSPVVYATFIVGVVFLPVLLMSGLQGRFFAPLGVSFLLATGASLLVALTVTPALCAALLARTKPHDEPRYIRWMKGWHLGLLHSVSRHPWLSAGAATALLAVALWASTFLGGEFLPEFREGHFVVQVTGLPGTSLPESLRLGKTISEEILAIPHVATVEMQTGRAEQGEDTWAPHRSELHVELDHHPDCDDKAVQEAIRGVLEEIPGIATEVLTFLGDRIGESISGETASVVVSIFGNDLDQLDIKAREVAAVLNGVPGAVDVQVKNPAGSPRYSVRLRPERLRQFGFRPLEVLEAVQTASQGEEVGELHDGNRVFKLAVRLDPAQLQEPESLGAMLISNADGLRLPLRELADLTLTTGRESIQHDGAMRRQVITCNTKPGSDVASFVRTAKKKVAAAVKFPAGVYPVFTGAAEAQETATRELIIHGGLTLIVILLVLSFVFVSWRSLFLVLVNVPFALVGGVLAAFVAGETLSLGSLVGFITLFGITTRNSIMMLSHFEHLVNEEGLAWNLETALRGASERLLPILMTALVTGLGLLPLAWSKGEAGTEIEAPMAIIILGGLLTSTALNLLLLPALAVRWGRFAKAAA